MSARIRSTPRSGSGGGSCEWLVVRGFPTLRQEKGEGWGTQAGWVARSGNPIRLAGDQEHQPTEHDRGAYEEHEAVEAVANHLPRRLSLGDAEDYRREQCE